MKLRPAKSKHVCRIRSSATVCCPVLNLASRKRHPKCKLLSQLLLASSWTYHSCSQNSRCRPLHLVIQFYVRGVHSPAAVIQALGLKPAFTSSISLPVGHFIDFIASLQFLFTAVMDFQVQWKQERQKLLPLKKVNHLCITFAELLAFDAVLIRCGLAKFSDQKMAL